MKLHRISWINLVLILDYTLMQEVVSLQPCSKRFVFCKWLTKRATSSTSAVLDSVFPPKSRAACNDRTRTRENFSPTILTPNRFFQSTLCTNRSQHLLPYLSEHAPEKVLIDRTSTNIYNSRDAPTSWVEAESQATTCTFALSVLQSCIDLLHTFQYKLRRCVILSWIELISRERK